MGAPLGTLDFGHPGSDDDEEAETVYSNDPFVAGFKLMATEAASGGKHIEEGTEEEIEVLEVLPKKELPDAQV